MQHVWLYIDLLKTSKEEPFSSVFSTDGTLISAFTAPYCGVEGHQKWYEQVELNRDCNHAKVERPCWNSVWEKSETSITVFVKTKKKSVTHLPWTFNKPCKAWTVSIKIMKIFNFDFFAAAVTLKWGQGHQKCLNGLSSVSTVTVQSLILMMLIASKIKEQRKKET